MSKLSDEKVCEFYNRPMKKFFEKNGIEMDTTTNEGKPVISKRFIKKLANQVYIV